MSDLYDVIIAGAGPIGLFLACELALAHTSVLVLERDHTPESQWKTAPLGRRGLNTLSVESFYRRGLLDKLFDLDTRPSSLLKTDGFQFVGHFAGLMLDGNKLDLSRWKYRLPGPGLVPGPTTIDQVETALAERAQSLGVEIIRGTGITKIAAEESSSVTVEAGENNSFRGRWLVGCDGGRSTIRKAAGFEFVGTEAEFTGYIATCDIYPSDKLKPGFNVTNNGMYIFLKPNTIYLVDFDSATFDRKQEISPEHLQDVLRRVSGISDVCINKIHLSTSFTDRSKQTTKYRKGRILLAGDAAHIHSPLGAQGLNLGLGDAMNLGWKLATTIRGEQNSDGAVTDFTLLDTYESERHPIAAWVLEWTRAQVATLQPDLYGASLRNLLRDLINTPDGTNLFVDRVWGLSQRYILGNGKAHSHPLVGCSAPDFELSDGSRLGPKLESGKGMFLCLNDNTPVKSSIIETRYEDSVEYLTTNTQNCLGLRALLLRPDGIVAWVVEEDCEPDLEALQAALQTWFAV